MNDQKSTVTRYVVVGMTLVALLLGGLYVVRNQSGTSGEQISSTSGESPKKDPAKKQAKPSDAVNPSQQGNGGASGVSTDTLPKTGAEQFIAACLAVLLTTYAMASYVQSRRRLADSHL